MNQNINAALRADYQSAKLVERLIASEVARQLSSRMSDTMRSNLIDAHQRMQSAQSNLRDVTRDAVNELFTDRTRY